MAGKGLQHGAPHALAVARIEAGAQFAPRERLLRRQAEDGGRPFAQHHAVAGGIPAPVAQAARGQRHLQAAVALLQGLLVGLAPVDVLEVQGEAVR